MKNNLYIKTGGDESYTYPNLVNILKPFMPPKDKIIWCPFDTKDSNYVKIFRDWGYKVKLSKKDFFDYEPKKWDIIISNPPFKNKRLFFERALSFNKPFAPIIWLNDGTPNKLFKDGLELIIPNRRAKFFDIHGNKIDKSINFKSAYFCKNFCKDKINFVDMPNVT